MSWIKTLADMYDYLQKEQLEHPGSVKNWLPICTLSRKAQIEIVISSDAGFIRGRTLQDEEAPTVIPVTEDSAARTSAPVPHPLFDGLEYIAGDLHKFFDKKNLNDNYHDPYMQGLYDWVEESNNPHLRIIYAYLAKGTLTTDLVTAGVLKTDDNGQLDTSEKIQASPQNKAMVRIAIESDGDLYKPWEDLGFLTDYSEYYLNRLEQKAEPGLCYISGEITPLADKHGKDIRRPGDGAKLISSNDKSNYTFRGRFSEPQEAVGISYEISEKAHAALRWLIRNQGYRNNDYVVVAFAQEEKPVQPYLDSQDALAFLQERGDEDLFATPVETAEAYAEEINKAVRGYCAHLDPHKKVSLIALDNAVPGRLAIQYYREFTHGEYLENLIYYYKSIAWIHRYKKDDEGRMYSFVGAPSPYDILKYAYGIDRDGRMELDSSKNKHVNQLLRRLLPCITERKPIPKDIVNQAVRAASSPLTKSNFNWRRALSNACGLVKKYYLEKKQEEYPMALDKSLSDRSYLFGRLLAIADTVEKRTYDKSTLDSGRQTNAMRLMNAFAKKPFTSWTSIELKIQPYFKRLKTGSRNYFQNELNQVMGLFNHDDFSSNKALEGTFLIGFHNQLEEFNNNKQQEEECEKNVE